MTTLPLPPFARPVVIYDQVLELTESTVVVAKRLEHGSPCFAGHFAGFPIFPGVFSVELVHQAARLYCENFFPEARLARLGARFSAPILPDSNVICQCTCKRFAEGRELRITGDCKVDGVLAAVVKLTFTRAES
jgi:3-hydroxyacyl-[acyl-carrier-protein] dehydratase